jgi:hypothetical protein
LANKSKAENPVEPILAENPESKGMPTNQLYFTSEPGLLNIDCGTEVKLYKICLFWEKQLMDTEKIKSNSNFLIPQLDKRWHLNAILNFPNYFRLMQARDTLL